MIILFSNCGFAIIAFLFYLCGSNRCRFSHKLKKLFALNKKF